MEEWDLTKSSGDLITEIRKIILVAPQTEWGIENGEFIESLEQKEFDADDL